MSPSAAVRPHALSVEGYELRRMREQAISLRRVSTRANSRQFNPVNSDTAAAHLTQNALLWLRSSPCVDTRPKRGVSSHSPAVLQLASGVHNLRGARGVSICASDILAAFLTTTPPLWSCRAGTTAQASFVCLRHRCRRVGPPEEREMLVWYASIPRPFR